MHRPALFSPGLETSLVDYFNRFATLFSSDWYGLYANPIVDPLTDGTRVVPSFCELCFWKCGILAHAAANKATGIYANYLEPDEAVQRSLYLAAAQRAEQAIKVLRGRSSLNGSTYTGLSLLFPGRLV